MLRSDLEDMLSESPFLNDTTYYPSFKTDNDSVVIWRGAHDADGNPISNGPGRVFFEVNNAASNNNWVKVSYSRQLGNYNY